MKYSTMNGKEKLQLLQLYRKRQRLFPTVHGDATKTASEIQQMLDHYAVEYKCYLNQYDDIDCNSDSDHHHNEHNNSRSSNKRLHSDFVIESKNDIEPLNPIDVKSSSSFTIQPSFDSAVDDVPSDNVVVSNDTISTQEQLQQQQSQPIITTTTLAPGTTNPIVVSSSSSSSSTVYDIWGRIPPKEYVGGTNNYTTSSNSSNTETTSLICTICQQKVGSSLRFASHLDKCLGIGTMSRNNNNGS